MVGSLRPLGLRPRLFSLLLEYAAQVVINQRIDRPQTQSEKITLVRTDAITWNDGSCGCPKPGTMYTQVLVPCYQVVLEA